MELGHDLRGKTAARRGRMRPFALAATALSLLATPLSAQPAAGRARPAAASVDPQRLAGLPEFLDGVIAQQMATRDVSGAVITVVHDGKVLLTRGWGHANIAEGRRVDAERTLFRPGSVSKMFTWVALMQQVEQGRVDLGAPVNDYLDFKIPNHAAGPIRVRDLLSHTPGLSDVGGLSVGGPSELRHYTAWLKEQAAAPLWAPGTESAYSNYGAALAGYIVERVSGQPYADYIDKNLFAPLEMRSSTFREPLSPEMSARMASSYRVTDGRMVAEPFGYYSVVMPAGSATASAPDMARFMLAMLGGGRLGSARILKPESVRLLQSKSIANAPRLPGMAHGFITQREAGPRIVGHGGKVQNFHSHLALAPEAGFGFFVSMAGGPNSGLARNEITQALIGRLFPQAPAPRWTGAEPPPPMGAYRFNRRDFSKTPDPAQDLKVSMTGPHRLTTEKDGVKLSWEQIGPRLYEQITGAREGGPFDQLEFHGTPQAPKLSFASQPHGVYHLVSP